MCEWEIYQQDPDMEPPEGEGWEPFAAAFMDYTGCEVYGWDCRVVVMWRRRVDTLENQTNE